MNRTDYVRLLAGDVRYRVRFDKEHGQILGLWCNSRLQWESNGSRWSVYDTAHGFAHRDRYRPDGTVQCHEPLPVADYNEALTLAVRTVRERGIELAEEFREEAQ